jgi:hypothetical protein
MAPSYVCVLYYLLKIGSRRAILMYDLTASLQQDEGSYQVYRLVVSLDLNLEIPHTLQQVEDVNVYS